jgi:hypothetical protein
VVAVGLFALLLAAGLGWAIALVPASVPVRVALAPASGVAALVLVGTVASVLGLRTSHTGSALGLVLVVAAGGFLAAFVAIRRRRAAAEPPT